MTPSIGFSGAGGITSGGGVASALFAGSALLVASNAPSEIIRAAERNKRFFGGKLILAGASGNESDFETIRANAGVNAKIYVLPGTYTFSDRALLTVDGQKWFMHGAVLKAADSTDITGGLLQINNADRVEINGGEFDGNKANTAAKANDDNVQNAIYISNSSDSVVIRNIYAHDFKANGVRSVTGSGGTAGAAEDLRVLDSEFVDNDRDGVNGRGVRAEVTGNKFRGNRDFINLSSDAGATVHDNTGVGPTLDGIVLFSSKGDVSITGNVLDGNGTGRYGILTSIETHSYVISDNTIYGFTSTNSAGINTDTTDANLEATEVYGQIRGNSIRNCFNGIAGKKPKKLTVALNTVHACLNNSLIITGDDEANKRVEDLLILDNTFDMTETGSPAPVNAVGLWLASVHRARIEGNEIVGHAGGSAGIDEGIRLSGSDFVDIDIKRNRFSGNGTDINNESSARWILDNDGLAESDEGVRGLGFLARRYLTATPPDTSGATPADTFSCYDNISSDEGSMWLVIVTSQDGAGAAHTNGRYFKGMFMFVVGNTEGNSHVTEIETVAGVGTSHSASVDADGIITYERTTAVSIYADIVVRAMRLT